MKDRRQVVRSLVDHLRNKFNVSVAEVDDLGVWRRATIGVVCVANETAFVHQVLDRVVNAVRGDPRASIIDYQTEIL
ncbi:MAG: DUF503 domain-containing protein [Armatimonadota bacterium]|nr:DUF503 domain-containing protein [Armatimonadota bacterium]